MKDGPITMMLPFINTTAFHWCWQTQSERDTDKEVVETCTITYFVCVCYMYVCVRMCVCQDGALTGTAASAVSAWAMSMLFPVFSTKVDSTRAEEHWVECVPVLHVYSCV